MKKKKTKKEKKTPTIAPVLFFVLFLISFLFVSFSFFFLKSLFVQAESGKK